MLLGIPGIVTMMTWGGGGVSGAFGSVVVVPSPFVFVPSPVVVTNSAAVELMIGMPGSAVVEAPLRPVRLIKAATMPPPAMITAPIIGASLVSDRAELATTLGGMSELSLSGGLVICSASHSLSFPVTLARNICWPLTICTLNVCSQMMLKTRPEFDCVSRRSAYN